MKCRRVAPYLVDLARGVALEAGCHAEVDRHVRECPRCAARLEDQRAMSSALRRLAQGAEVPAPDQGNESAVLAAFDAAWGQPRARAHSRRWLPLAAAALLALAATATWTIAQRVNFDRGGQRRMPAQRLAELPSTEFVLWPGASSLPTFESGQLMRMDLPASMARSLGLNPPASQNGVVTADVLVGQDGFARAVRLAP
jgi:hypothetical protein